MKPEELRAHETSVLMGLDAMRICMNMDPQHFPHDEVVQWMNNLRREYKPRPAPSHTLVYNKATKQIDRVRLVDGLVADSFEPPEECA